LDENSADASIRAALARDDPAAVEFIWDRYAADLLAFLIARLCSRNEAEDVLQTLFVTIASKRYVLAQAGCLAAYLFRMARHEAATYLRSRRCHRQEVVDTGLWLELRDEGIRHFELVEQLQVSLSQLPEAQRDVVVLKVYRDKTFGEIAQLLNVSPNTAASRYRYGMERLRNLLKDSAL